MGTQDNKETGGEVFPGGQPRNEEEAALMESFRREDERWSRASQQRDWLILIVAGILWAAWMIATFLFEPGIR